MDSFGSFGPTLRALGQATLPGVADALSRGYTAHNHVSFSYTRTGQQGTFDINWHWYDPAGQRLMTEVRQDQVWSTPLPGSGSRTYYIPDGDNVGMEVIRG